MNNSRTVLVVDDDPQVLLAIQKRLMQAGYRVRTALDGADALEQARHGSVDAISLDVRLPGDVDGLEVASRLQMDARTQRIPIVFITGSADDDFKHKCHAAGGKYFLAKPYDPDLLLQVLRTIFAADELGEIRRISEAKRRQLV